MPQTQALTWDDNGERTYEIGTKKGVFFGLGNDGVYEDGIAWSGLTAVTESPSGDEETALWADDIKYAGIRSAAEFGGTIEAYQCPREFYPCIGLAVLAPGVYIGMQRKKKFGFSWVTTVGNDVEGLDYGYKLHIVYGATANTPEMNYQTINDSPDAMTLSWEFTTDPIKAAGFRPTAVLTFESKEVGAEKMAALEEILYGSSTAASRLPLPDEIKTLMST